MATWNGKMHRELRQCRCHVFVVGVRNVYQLTDWRCCGTCRWAVNNDCRFVVSCGIGLIDKVCVQLDCIPCVVHYRHCFLFLPVQIYSLSFIYLFFIQQRATLREKQRSLGLALSFNDERWWWRIVSWYMVAGGSPGAPRHSIELDTIQQFVQSW